jgi:histidinol-phosphate aminotransferase
VIPTSASFLFCDVGGDAATFANRLQEEGVAVRPLGHWGAPTCIRVTIGTAEQNQIFLRAAGKVHVAPRLGLVEQASRAETDRRITHPHRLDP